MVPNADVTLPGEVLLTGPSTADGSAAAICRCLFPSRRPRHADATCSVCGSLPVVSVVLLPALVLSARPRCPRFIFLESLVLTAGGLETRPPLPAPENREPCVGLSVFGRGLGPESAGASWAWRNETHNRHLSRNGAKIKTKDQNGVSLTDCFVIFAHSQATSK